MEFLKLIFNPGINKETTRYASSGGWWDCDKIRFRAGAPEKIKGWVKLTTSVFLGTCRSLFRWQNLATTIYTAIGTELRMYLEDGGTLNELTPWTIKDEALSSPFTTTNTSDSVEVTKASHGRVVGDRIVVEGASAVGGIGASDLNGVREIDTVADTNTYTFTAGDVATSSTTGGGASVTIYYLLQDGLDTAITGTGWGSDAWSDGAWGEPGSAVSSASTIFRTWSFDNFGEDLFIVVWDVGVFYWDSTTGVSVRPFPLATIAGASNTPAMGRVGIVASNSRHAIVFGCDTIGNPGVQDPLHIRWSDRENIANWTPGTTTTSGSLTIGSGDGIVAAKETRQEILVWTNTDMHSMQYIGGEYNFGINLVAKGTSIIGRNVVAVYLGVAYWMGETGFYKYDGQVREIPCTVEDYVLNDINLDSREKITAGVNSNESEIIWHYPSAGSDENDRYVIYNMRDDLWYIGTMARTAWIDRSVSSYPLAASPDGYIYTHEFGNLDGSTTPESQIVAHVESSPFELGQGYHYMFIDRLIPDITFRGSTEMAPSVDMTMTVYDNPGLSATDTETDDSARSATTPVEQFTDNLWIRMRGRSMTYRVEDTASANTKDFSWRLGVPRLSVRTDGRK